MNVDLGMFKAQAKSLPNGPTAIDMVSNPSQLNWKYAVASFGTFEELKTMPTDYPRNISNNANERFVLE